jgi:predicted metal-dependent peptidase
MIEKVIVSLIKTKPFYAHFLQQMNRIETERIPTLGVNLTDRINLFFNPVFLEGLNPKARIACLEHEVLHLLNLHLFRGKELEERLFNIAADLAINPFISNLPSCALLPEQFGLEEGNTAEWYYAKLVKERDEVERRIAKAGLRVLDDHGVWKDSKENPVLREEILKRAIRLSLNETQDYGSLPGNLMEELKEFLENSSVNWRRVLERFLIHATLIRLISSRKRPNRRFEDFPGERVEQRLKLLIGLDTSGSIGDRELSLFFSEIEKIKALGMEIRVAECDTKVGNVYRYRTRPKAVSGRGGTDFRPVFDLARKIHPDALIYLTDGFGEYPETARVPTLWCLTPEGRFSGSFGKMIQLPAVKKQ